MTHWEPNPLPLPLSLAAKPVSVSVETVASQIGCTGPSHWHFWLGNRCISRPLLVVRARPMATFS